MTPCPLAAGAVPGGLERFARHYLAGYREERTLGTAQLGWLPLFLSLLEVGVYTQVCGQAGADDTWVARFLRGRRERILAGAPYADLDWAGLAGAESRPLATLAMSPPKLWAKQIAASLCIA